MLPVLVMADAKMQHPALRGDCTVFSDKVQTLVEALETATLTYQTVATRKKAGSNAFKPLLLPSFKYSETSRGARDPPLSQFSHHRLTSSYLCCSAPSLGSATAFLKDTVILLQERLLDVADLADRLDNFDATAMDELEEVSALTLGTDQSILTLIFTGFDDTQRGYARCD